MAQYMVPEFTFFTISFVLMLWVKLGVFTEFFL